MKLKSCIYSSCNSVLKDSINLELLNIIGFENSLVKGDVSDLLEYLNNNSVNVVIADSFGFEYDRFVSTMNLVYNNYCKNIIIISDGSFRKISKFHYINRSELRNIDIKLSEKLLAIKTQLEEKPSYSVVKVKTKAHELFSWLKFSPKNSGFRYFVDAAAMMFFEYPKRLLVVDMYNEIGKDYNKTGVAIEKAMRTALANAIKAVRRLPECFSNKEIKEIVKPDLSNLGIISVVVGKILLDKDFAVDLYKNL